MNKEICKQLKEEGFSEDGLEMAEAFFLFAKNGLGFLTPGDENGRVVVWGEAKDFPKADIKRLKELGWDHPQAEEDEEWWDYGIEDSEWCWEYNCH